MEPTALALELHNDFRKKHGVPPMALDHELTRVAERYARSLANKKDVNIDLTNLGVNILETKISGEDRTSNAAELAAVRHAMGTWYGQKRLYNWDSPMSSPIFAENFYEIVWKSTTRLGVALDSSRDGKLIYVVALYERDGGSVTDQGHKENVFP